MEYRPATHEYKDKYPRTPHWPTSPGATSDDKWIADPEGLISGLDWTTGTQGPIELVGTEKMDGQNTRMCNGQAYARSADLPAHHGWMAMAWKHHVWKTTRLGAKISVFAEDIYGVHSIRYNPVREEETLRVFAVREDTTWLSWDDVKLFCEVYDFPIVAELFRGTIDSQRELSKLMDTIGAGPSTYGPTIEGSVFRWAHAFDDSDFDRAVAKWVRKGHVQTDEHWTRNWQPCELIR